MAANKVISLSVSDQGILALTSQRVYPDDPSWATNGAGIAHSYKFGFGVANALAAVEASKTWKTWGAEQQIVKESGKINAPISDGQTPTVVTMFIESDEVAVARNSAGGTTVESVVVYLELK